MRRRWLAVGALAAVLVSGAISLAPFNDRGVRCGPPLFGAEPPANYSITPGTCSDVASDRLLGAAVLMAVSVVLSVAATRSVRM